MNIDIIIQNTTHEKTNIALRNFLTNYTKPVFGALPKSEIDFLVLTLLEELGAISSEPEQYELTSLLKVTSGKARTLIYGRALRTTTSADLDVKLLNLLKRPIIQKHGELFSLEVENPLVSDHLKARVKKLGYISDGSFSPNLVKLSLEAISALIESCIAEPDRNAIKKILIVAGAPDKSFNGLIKAALKKIASKVASEAGESMMDEASEYIIPIITADLSALKKIAKEII